MTDESFFLKKMIGCCFYGKKTNLGSNDCLGFNDEKQFPILLKSWKTILYSAMNLFQKKLYTNFKIKINEYLNTPKFTYLFFKMHIINVNKYLINEPQNLKLFMYTFLNRRKKLIFLSSRPVSRKRLKCLVVTQISVCPCDNFRFLPNYFRRDIKADMQHVKASWYVSNIFEPFIFTKNLGHFKRRLCSPSHVPLRPQIYNKNCI